MSRPAEKDCHALVANRDGSCDVRAARFGKAPLVHLWVHEYGNGGRSIVLDFDQTVALIDGLNDLLDEIEGE